MDDITAICISTTHGKCLPVLLKSIEQYVPSQVEIYLAFTSLSYMDFHSKNHSLVLCKSEARNFGDAYNFICNRAFEKHDNIVIANDDIVFNPDSFDKLQEDWKMLNEYDDNKLGYLAARSNYVRGVQNVRWHDENAKTNGLQYAHEKAIIETSIIAPICAVINRHSWIDFLPINLYSDDVQCLMMAKQKKKHFVSRGYVHHVGSQTVDYSAKEHEETMVYLKEHFIEYYHYLKA